MSTKPNLISIAIIFYFQLKFIIQSQLSNLAVTTNTQNDDDDQSKMRIYVTSHINYYTNECFASLYNCQVRSCIFFIIFYISQNRAIMSSLTVDVVVNSWPQKSSKSSCVQDCRFTNTN